MGTLIDDDGEVREEVRKLLRNGFTEEGVIHFGRQADVCAFPLNAGHTDMRVLEIGP